MKSKTDAGQLSLFSPSKDRVTSFPVNTDDGAGDLGQVAGSGKIKLDIDDMERQLKELAPGVPLKVKMNKHQGSAARIYENDKGYLITINPSRWRGEKKTEFLTDFIIKTVANGFCK